LTAAVSVREQSTFLFPRNGQDLTERSSGARAGPLRAESKQRAREIIASAK